VARWQLARLGFSESWIARGVRSGALVRLHAGVFAVGHGAVGQSGRRFAAVLTVGPDAVLSHRSAGETWGLCSYAGARAEVTAPRTLRARARLLPHRAVLLPDERTVIDGLPITTVARTLLDLAMVLDRHRLERAVERAEMARLLDLRAVAALLDRHRRRPGAGALRVALPAATDPRVTRSDFEDAFLAFLAARDLPRPSSGVWVPMDDGEGPGVELDVAWPAARLAVELDPRSTHGTAAAFERDRHKDQRLMLAGWRVVRLTPRRLREEPDCVAATLRRLLQGDGW